jgi:hypothetical protein
MIPVRFIRKRLPANGTYTKPYHTLIIGLYIYAHTMHVDFMNLECRWTLLKMYTRKNELQAIFLVLMFFVDALGIQHS